MYEEHAQKAQHDEEDRKQRQKDAREKRMRQREKIFQMLQKKEDGKSYLCVLLPFRCPFQ